MSYNYSTSSSNSEPTLSVGDNKVPYELTSSRLPKPIPTNSRILSIPASNGSSASAGSMITFQLPNGSGSGYLRSQSSFVRFKVVVQNADLSGISGWSWSGSTASAGSLFNRLSISLGGVQLEQVNNYSFLHSIILDHTCDSSYLVSSANILEGALGNGVNICPNQIASGNVAQAAVAPPLGALQGFICGETYEFCVPLCSGILQNPKSYPLFLSNAPLTIQLDINQLITAMKPCVIQGSAGTDKALGSFTVSNPEFVYEAQYVSPEMEASIKAVMATTGKLYELPITTTMSLQTSVAQNAGLSYNIGLNLSSVNCVLYGQVASTDLTSTGNQFFTKLESQDSTVNRRLFLDGKQVVSYNITTDDLQYAELRRCVNSISDTQINPRVSASFRSYNGVGTIQTAANSNSSNTYTRVSFVGGCNTRRFNSEDMCFAGTSANQITLLLDRTTSVAGNVYIFVVYDQILVFDAMGSVAIAK